MRTSVVAALAALTSATLLAQAQGQQQRSPSTRPGPVTVRGCLTAAANNQFTLTAAKDANAQRSATGTSGTTGAASKGEVKTIEYALVAPSGVDLKSHVGHTVEVTGSESAPVGEAAGKAVSPSTTAPGDVRGGAKAKVQTSARADVVARQLTVARVRDVAATCSAKQ